MLNCLASAFCIDRLSPHQFRGTAPHPEPVVVEDIIDLKPCDEWLSHILTRSGHEMVNVQREFGVVQQKTLDKAIEMAMANSRHSDGIYITSKTDNGSSCSTDQLALYDVQEDLFADIDWLPYFAYYTTVSDALIVSGNGGTSELECYPWTTTKTCLNGYQIWRLIPPDYGPLLQPQPTTTTV